MPTHKYTFYNKGKIIHTCYTKTECTTHELYLKRIGIDYDLLITKIDFEN